MITKAFELNKIDINENNFYLFYGENEGFINETINKYFKEKYSQNIYRYEEKEILDNKDEFFNNILSNSLFEKEKLIIILRSTDKIKKIIEELFLKKIDDIKFILTSGILEKKSKLRNFFEKEKNLVCVAFYADSSLVLSNLAINFFKEKKIPISKQTINLLVERSRGNRGNLNKELEKIENYSKNGKKINSEDILKLTNLAENYNVNELADNCLAKNQKKTVHILNENNFSHEDCILIIRTILVKAKRVLKLQKEIKNNTSLEQVFANFKPPIFWKDKEIVKKQVINWPENKIENMIYNISETELLIKKNYSNSLNILSDFIIFQSSSSN